MLCFSVTIRERGHQLDSRKSDFHPTSALSATTWYSIPYAHVPIEAWMFCQWRMLYRSLAQNLALFRRLLTVRMIMRPLTIHRLLGVYNAECLLSCEPCKESIFSWGRFHRPSCPFSFIYTSVWFTHCFNRTMTEWLTLNSLAVCVWHTTLYHSNRLSSLCIWKLSTGTTKQSMVESGEVR